MEEETQRQGGFDREVRVLRWRAPRARSLRFPGCDGRPGQPDGDVAPTDQGSLVGRPVSDAVFRLVFRMDSRLHPSSLVWVPLNLTLDLCNNASQRRGSTPRGSRHAGDQRQLPESETSAARSEFLYALNDALSYEAWVQLRTCTQDGVPTWAARWGIHAPCVLEAARAIVAFASQESDPPNIEVRKKCTRSGDRCRHHYVYRFGLRGNDYFGKTRRSNYASAMAVAHAEYQRIERALGDPPPEWRSLSE